MTWNVPEHLRFETPFSSPACEDVELVVIHGTVTPVVSPDSQWIDAAHVLAKLHRLVPDPSDFSSAVRDNLYRIEQPHSELNDDQPNAQDKPIF